MYVMCGHECVAMSAHLIDELGFAHAPSQCRHVLQRALDLAQAEHAVPIHVDGVKQLVVGWYLHDSWRVGRSELVDLGQLLMIETDHTPWSLQDLA